MNLIRSAWSRIEKFLAAILLTVAFAALMPARTDAAAAVSWLTSASIALLFFLHGARLSPEFVLLGARHWRLHAMVFVSTFLLFPLLGTSRAFPSSESFPGAALGGADSTHRAAVDSAGIDRVHIRGKWQRAGDTTQRFCFESARRFPHPANRRLPASPPRR